MSIYGRAINSSLPIDACRRGFSSHPMFHQCDKCDCKTFCEIYPLLQENKNLLEVSDAEFFEQLKTANAQLQENRLQQKNNQPNFVKRFFEKVADFFEKK